MFSWKDYYYEREKRADQIDRAEHYRQVRSCARVHQNRLQLIVLRMLEGFGAGLARWGENLECRCSAIIHAQTKRSTSLKI